MTEKSAGIDFSKFIAQLTTVFKAVPTDKLADLKDSIDHVGAAEIPDMWNMAGGEHGVPSRAQIVTGPAEPMSGKGAEKMIREYSDLSAQGGLTAVYATFHNMMSDFGKSMQGNFDKKFTALASVVSDVAKSHAAIESALQAAAEPVAKAEVNLDDTFLGKALEKFAKARAAFRKAEMCDEDDEKEERKSKIAEASNLLKSALKMISKADDEEKHDDEEMEKAVSSVKALAGKVSVALAAITKAECDEDEKEKAEKARVAAEAAVKADAGTVVAPAVKAEDTDEEKKDDTAKSLAALKAHMAQLEGAITGNGEVLQTTLKGFMETISGMSRTLVTPPNMAVIKAGVDANTRWQSAVDAGQFTGSDLMVGNSIASHMKAPGFPPDRLTQEINAAPQHVRQIFVA